ncbi:metal ABC transporter permease [Thalassobacillus sp. C254]|uniref:metal ABC transporter permease n=1 Tax=Thalassobacillus sp. C254 TaxID=1225341 RepID=UPI0006CFBF2A|nr:metal ABC transporter permease [Thalassobacillus sp. C254]
MDFLFGDLTFIQRGVLAALIVGFICPLLGSFLLVRRVTIISESLSHVTLTGISAGVLMGQTMQFMDVNPLYSGLLFALIGSLLIEKLRQEYRHFQELAIPIILSAGIGLSAILISIAQTGYTEWFNYLFGSIVSVTQEDLLFIIVTAFVVLLIMIFFFKEFISISFDQEYAKVSGISLKGMNFLFSLLVALVISMSMKVVGILLVGALIALPVAAAIRVAKSFKQVMFLGVLFGEAAILSGVYISYHMDIATGGTIVMSAMFILAIVACLQMIFSRS